MLLQLSFGTYVTCLKFITVDFSTLEGCTNLASSLEGVRMTTEGIVIIEEPGKNDSAVKIVLLCVTCFYKLDQLSNPIP